MNLQNSCLKQIARNFSLRIHVNTHFTHKFKFHEVSTIHNTHNNGHSLHASPDGGYLFPFSAHSEFLFLPRLLILVTMAANHEHFILLLLFSSDSVSEVLVAAIAVPQNSAVKGYCTQEKNGALT